MVQGKICLGRGKTRHFCKMTTNQIIRAAAAQLPGYLRLCKKNDRKKHIRFKLFLPCQALLTN